MPQSRTPDKSNYVQPEQPASPSPGDRWFDTAAANPDEALKVYSWGEWRPVGGGGGGGGSPMTYLKLLPDAQGTQAPANDTPTPTPLTTTGVDTLSAAVDGGGFYVIEPPEDGLYRIGFTATLGLGDTQTELSGSVNIGQGPGAAEKPLNFGYTRSELDPAANANFSGPAEVASGVPIVPSITVPGSAISVTYESVAFVVEKVADLSLS